MHEKNKKSIFAKEGSATIVEKLSEVFTIRTREVLKQGRMFISKRKSPDQEYENMFVLTKTHLYYLFEKTERDRNLITIKSIAKIELQWVHSQFYNREGDDGHERLYFSFNKNGKSAIFRVEDKLEYEEWKRLLFIHTIQSNFFEVYKVLSSIGVGSTANVFKIQDSITGQYYACKRFKKSKLVKSAYKYLVNEINVLRKVQGHPNIVKFHGLFESSNSVYIITELCEGGRLIKPQQRYKSFEIAEMAKTLIKLLGYLKKHEIVHRDLKPGNILLKYENQPITQNQIKVIDFGISATKESEHEEYKVLGTVGYMCPESFYMSYLPNHKFDIYSLGVVLYNGITGKKLFMDRTKDKMMINNKRGKVDFFDFHFQAVDKERKLISKEHSVEDAHIRRRNQDQRGGAAQQRHLR